MGDPGGWKACGLQKVHGVKLPLGWLVGSGGSLLPWVGVCGDGFWLEGERVRVMGVLLPPMKAGRTGLGCLLPSYSPNPRLTRGHIWLQPVEEKAEVKRGHKLRCCPGTGQPAGPQRISIFPQALLRHAPRSMTGALAAR